MINVTFLLKVFQCQRKVSVDSIVTLLSPTAVSAEAGVWLVTTNTDTLSCLDQGKDKLEWYRTVDAAKLEHLKEMMAADNYKENLGTLIR